jgi:hypothetical protein
MPSEPIRAPLGVNVPGFAMAGFQVTLHGRIWVTAEGMHANLEALRERYPQQKLFQLKQEILAQELAKLPPAISPEPVDIRTFEEREQEAITLHARLMSNCRADFGLKE